MATDGVGIPAVEGVVDLVAELDSLVERRPPRDPALPLLLVVGDGSGRFVLGFRERLRSSQGQATVPHVLVGDPGHPAPADDLELLEHLANEACRALPPGTGSIDLPAFRTVRDVLDVQCTSRRYRDRPRELRDKLYARRREAGPVVEWLDNLVSSTSPNRVVSFGQALLRPLALDLPRRLYGRRLARGRRYRWFGEQIARVTGRGDDDFFTAALCLTRNGEERVNALLIRRVLLLALLHDLDHAFRGASLWSWRRRQRVTPFVLLFDRVATGDAAFRLLDTWGGLLDDEAGRTTLAVAALRGDVPPSLLAASGGRRLAPADAAAALAPLHRGSPSDQRVLVVPVPDQPVNEPAEAWLAVNQKAQPAVARLPFLAPVASYALAVGVVAVLLASAWGVVRDRTEASSCPGIEQVDDERIGVGDGTVGCSFVADDDELVEEVRAVEEAIAAENAEVVAGGARYATVVFFAPLTLPNAPATVGQTSLRQLRGIQLAQEETNNRLARSDEDKVPIRVLLANPGDRFAHGERVAGEIVEAAESDETIVGVVGIGQSRSSSRRAIRILAEHHLPVVAGPVTGDEMVTTSKYYYQVSPLNRRVADVLVSFARNQPIVGPDDDPARPLRNAVVVLDHTDEYSRNLAEDLLASLSAAGLGNVQAFSYPVAGRDEDEDADEEDLVELPGWAESQDNLADLAGAVCGSIDIDSDVVFFAGRAPQLAGLLNNMIGPSACNGRITIVGGTDITKFVGNPEIDLGRYGRMRIYYGAFASAELRISTWAEVFFTTYLGSYEDDATGADLSDAATTFDALLTMQTAINVVFNDQVELTPDTVAGALASGQVDFDGATGHIAVRGDDEHRVPERKPVLVLDAHRAGDPPLLACGLLAGEVDYQTWGDGAFACP